MADRKNHPMREAGEQMLAVLRGTARHGAFCADGLKFMLAMPEKSVDLVLGSPPYEARRQYDELQFSKRGQEWVDWMLPFVKAAVRLSRGLAIFVVGHGETNAYRWSGAPALLMADCIRAGINLRCPLIYHRNGVFGSGGPDYLRYNYEFVLVAQDRPEKLAWANNCAGGRPPKYGPGGEASHRLPGGRRVNQWGGNESEGGERRSSDKRQKKGRPSHRTARLKRENGQGEEQHYTPPVLANPGTVFTQPSYTGCEVEEILESIQLGCLSTHKVGGGHMGSKLAHLNEAPFPLSLAERYVLAFCPPGGVVFDPYLGSGTTLHAAVENGRRALGCDLRPKQVELAKRRLSAVTPKMIVIEDEEYKRRMEAKEAQPPDGSEDHPAPGEAAGRGPAVAVDAAGD